MITIELILLLLALIALSASAVGVTSRINLQSLGLALVVAAMVLRAGVSGLAR